MYNNKSQTIDNSNYQKRRYNSQLSQLNQNLENEFNNKSINQNNNNKIKNNLNYSGLKIGGMSSTLDKTLNERERKKMLLDNIQTQITLRKKTKLEELKKRQEEDAQYLKDMILRYPFGRGGGGAPIRDKSGHMVTFRRNLISDMKYNQSQIDVDDDYDEVWGKEKRIRENNTNKSQNINNNKIDSFNDENTLRPFSTNIQINTKKSNIMNLDNYQNNRYKNNINTPSTLKNIYNFSTNNLLNSGNNLKNFSNSINLMNDNNLLYRKILDRKKKELELEKQNEIMENEIPQVEYNNNQNDRIVNLRSPRKKVVFNNVIKENESEYNNGNENENKYLNKKDYYDNYNFVPKGQIHPRLENSFLFTDEINKLKNEIRIDQNSLLDEIQEIKNETKNAKKERNKVIKDLEYLKFEINRIKEMKKMEEEEKEKEKEINYEKNFMKDEKYDEYIENMIKRKENDNYYYIDNSSFKNYENELPNESRITRQKNIFNVKKTYMDENQMELDELIKKSNDILQNLKDNEIIERNHKRKPDDYFNTSDIFFHTYRLNHANDYKEYDENYDKYYHLNKYNNDKDDYEVKIEKI